MSSVCVKTVAGTGATLDVTLGFKPTYVKIVQAGTGDMHEYYLAGESESTPEYGSSVVASTGVRTVQTSAANGVKASDGDTGSDGEPDQSVGIEIGATCPVNDNGVNIFIFAVDDLLNTETYTPEYYNS